MGCAKWDYPGAENGPESDLGLGLADCVEHSRLLCCGTVVQEPMTCSLLGMHQSPIDLNLEVSSDTRVLDLREADVLARTLGLD